MNYPVNWLEDELRKALAQLGPKSDQIARRGYRIISEEERARWRGGTPERAS